MTELSGITRAQCPASCVAERCIITERPHCGHPCKGGFPEALKSDQGAVARYDEARHLLGLKTEAA